jgi:hypothetical protein
MKNTNLYKRNAEAVEANTQRDRRTVHYVVYTVGGWYREGATNNRVMFQADAERMSLRKAQRIISELDLMPQDIHVVER